MCLGIAVDKYWGLLLQSLGSIIRDWLAAGNAGAPVVSHAVFTLQTMLLARPEGIPESPDTWKLVFYDVLFPLASNLGAAGASATRTPVDADHTGREVGVLGVSSRGCLLTLSHRSCVRACVVRVTAEAGASSELQAASTRLLTLTFLHSAAALAGMPDFHLLWLKLIGAVAKDLRAASMADDRGGRGSGGGRSARFETTLEAVKNMLLVVTAEGLVDDACRRTGQDVWALTWTIIDSVCPSVRPTLQEVCPQRPAETDGVTGDSGHGRGDAASGDASAGAGGAGNEAASGDARKQHSAGPDDATKPRTQRSPTLAELEMQLRT